LKTWAVILRRKKACPERSRRAEESHFLSYKEILHSAARSLSSSEAKGSDLSLSKAKEWQFLWLFNRAKLLHIVDCQACSTDFSRRDPLWS